MFDQTEPRTLADVRAFGYRAAASGPAKPPNRDAVGVIYILSKLQLSKTTLASVRICALTMRKHTPLSKYVQVTPRFYVKPC